jgi:hypothetical protein
MDGSSQCGSLHATTLWHFDAAEWAVAVDTVITVNQHFDELSCFE